MCTLGDHSADEPHSEQPCFVINNGEARERISVIPVVTPRM